MNQSTQTTGGRVRRAASVASLAALVVALVGAAASPAVAQAGCGPTGEDGYNLCGFVTDTDGNGIGGVTVTVTGDGGGPVTTNSDGSWYTSVGAGPWQVAVDVTTIPPGSVVTPPSTTVTLASDTEVRSNVNFVVSSLPGEELESDLVPAPCDFVTSGGFVVKDDKKVSFGAHGGCKNGEFWGHVNVVDHSTGYHINSDEITGFLAPFGMLDNTRDICGWASTNKSTDPQPVRFRVRLTDNGEPGSLDTWGIVVGAPATYVVTPRLLSADKPGGGNVQLHKPNPSTTAPSLPGDLCGGVTFPAP